MLFLAGRKVDSFQKPSVQELPYQKPRYCLGLNYEAARFTVFLSTFFVQRQLLTARRLGIPTYQHGLDRRARALYPDYRDFRESCNRHELMVGMAFRSYRF